MSGILNVQVAYCTHSYVRHCYVELILHIDCIRQCTRTRVSQASLHGGKYIFTSES